MTPRNARITLLLALGAFAALSVAFNAQRRENDRLRSENARVVYDIEGLAVRAGSLQKENEALKARLGNIERGVVIPAGTRRAIEQAAERGEPWAPSDRAGMLKMERGQKAGE